MSTTTTPLATAWATFERLQVPADTTPEDRLMLRRIFYAGAYSLAELTRACDRMQPCDATHCRDMMDTEVRMFCATFGSTLEGRV